MWRYLTGCILIVIGAYFLYDFPGNGKKTGDLEIQRNTVGTQRAA